MCGMAARCSLACISKPRILCSSMTRGAACFLLSACFAWTLGCGARTSTLEDEDFGGRYPGGASGGAPVGGSHPGGGGSFGGSLPVAGGGAIAGASPVAGSGGASPVAGSGGAFGGSSPVAGGGGSFAGFGAIGGSFAGFGGAVGGSAGASGSAGAGGAIEELCSVLGSSSCEQCLCKSCADPIVSCFSDVGCAFIFACAQQTGCQGLSCYSPNTCKSVIDQFGGLTGAPVRELFALASCTASSQNSCSCN